MRSWTFTISLTFQRGVDAMLCRRSVVVLQIPERVLTLTLQPQNLKIQVMLIFQVALFFADFPSMGCLSSTIFFGNGH